jgi:hypothetical protein
MRMCEFANNLFDMFLLVYLTKKNGKIVYKEGTYHKSLLYVISNYSFFNMVFPRMYGGLHYIELENAYRTITFEKISEIDLDYFIISGV